MRKILFKLMILLLLAIFAYFQANAQCKSDFSQIQNNSPSHPVEYKPQPFDVISYEADIDLTAAPAKIMTGKCRILALITGQKDTSDFIFHLRGLKVDSVFYYNTNVSALTVSIPDSADYHFKFSLSTAGIPIENITSEDTADIVIYYSGTMTPEIYKGQTGWGGVQSSGGVLYAMGVGFKNNYISATQHWLPCYDHPSDKATFTGRFRIKKNLVCASIGLPAAAKQINDSINEYEWKHNISCATYLYTFAVGDYRLIKYEDENLPYYLYTQAKDSVNTAYNFKLLPRMVKAFEKRFGKYPFDKVGYVNTPTGSMEHQTLISYDWQLLKQKDTVNSIAAHELAHQWFGDMVSCYDYRDAWLSEGFATYCEAIWAEELFGFPKYLDNLTNKINGYINNIALQEGVFSLFDFPRTGNSSNYPATIYYKGAAVVGMLRYKLGDEKFFAAMNSYIKKYGYANTSTELLKSELETISGMELDSFFNQWVYGKGWPKLKIIANRTRKGNNINDISFEITQMQADNEGIYTDMPLELGFRKPDNTYEYTKLTLNGKVQIFQFNDIPDFNDISFNKGPNLRALVQIASYNILDAEEPNNAISIKIYPNPSNGILNIQSNGYPGNTCYRITDIYGKNIFSGILEQGDNMLDLNSDMLNLTSGIYFFTADMGSKTKTYTFSVIK